MLLCWEDFSPLLPDTVSLSWMIMSCSVDIVIALTVEEEYRVTHHVVPDLPLI